jgi:acetyl esterase/lipase
MRIVEYKVGKHKVKLVGYLRDHNERNERRNTRPCVILCPGGGYRMLSPTESDPVSLSYFALGLNVFTLFYSLSEQASDFAPLLELSESVCLVRKNAHHFEIDPDKIAVMGFSAGGHLAASLAVLHHHEAFMRVSGIRDGSNKPNAALLCYPVITSGKYRHERSIENVSGGKERLKNC